MIILTRQLATWALCLVFVAGLALSSYGSVLCVGNDGQVKVKSICQPYCSDAEEACEFEAEPGGHEHQNECTDCTDLDLYQNSARYRPTTPKYDFTLIQLDLHRPPAPPVLHLSTSFSTEWNQAAPESPPNRHLLATTVLIC